MEIWHKRIKELREKTDVTLKDMAKIIGVSEATVQRYESGKIHELPYKVIIAYAEKFHVFPSYIMGWSDTPAQFTLFDIPQGSDNTIQIEFPQHKKIEPSNSELDPLIEYLRTDETIRQLVKVAVTCTEDDIEMAIKLLKYFRIRG